MSRTRPAARARRNIEIHATWHRCLCLAVMERGWLPDADVQATALFKLSHKRSQRLKTSTDTAAVVSLPVYMAQYLRAVRALALCKTRARAGLPQSSRLAHAVIGFEKATSQVLP